MSIADEAYAGPMPYRWLSGSRKGAWQPTRREAVNNAIAAGVAKRGEAGEIAWIEDGSVEYGDGRRRSETRSPQAAG